MKKEDKELLLQDLCARLPYGVKISRVVGDWISDPHLIRSIRLNNIIVEDGEFEDGTPDIDAWDYEEIKPYLFPMSSMAEEEYEEYRNIDNRSYSCPIEYAHIPASDRINWLNKNHFDYRSLIEKGLALNATGLNIY